MTLIDEDEIINGFVSQILEQDSDFLLMSEEEQEKIYAQAREETRRRYSKVTQGHTPNRPKQPRRKTFYRG